MLRRKATTAPVLCRLAVAVPMVLITIGLTSAKAWANTENAIKISVGQTVTKTYSDLVGDDAQGDAYQQAGNANYTSNAQDPPDCDPLPSCDDIPLVLNLPKSELGPNNNYLLEISLTYAGGPGAATPLGTQTVNTISGSLWDSPIPSKGPHANGQDGSCFTDPCVINEASPDVATLSLVADQITGTADQFVVTLKLVDVGSGAGASCPGVSGGQGAPACPAAGSGSGSSGGGAGQSPAQPAATPSSASTGGALPPSPQSASLPSTSSIGLGLPSFQLEAGGPNPVLSALSTVQLGSVLGIGGKSLKQGTFLGIPKAQPASTLAVVLSMVTAPVLLAGGWLFMSLRRRRLAV